MEFRATKQFQEKFYNTTLQDKLSIAIWRLSQSLETRRTGNATRWPNQLKPVKGLDSKWPPMREFKISDAGRIIFTESANPVLFDFEMTHTALENLKAKVSATAAKQRIAKATILKIIPQDQLPEAANLSSSGGNTGSFLFEEELFNSWVVHLSLIHI